MAIDFETVKTSLYDWAVSILGGSIPVIFYNENSPRPALPYVTLHLQSIVQIGDEYETPPNGSGIIDLIGDREFTLQIQCYGGDPLTILENLRTSLQKSTVLDTLRANQIAFVQHFPINDITGLFDTKFEPRASMDVLFRIAQTDNEDDGLIETTEVQEILSDGVSTIFDETITIPSP